MKVVTCYKSDAIRLDAGIRFRTTVAQSADNSMWPAGLRQTV
ncbi:MAG: hypothetical protein ABSH11_10190 [Verrucomicrobiota bacterium]